MGTLYTIRSGASSMPEDTFLQDISDLLMLGGVKDLSSDNHFKVTERGAGQNMSVDVSTGRAFVKTSGINSAYPVRHESSVTNLSIAANSSGSPRKDTIILWIDTAASPTSSADNVAKLRVVQGVPSGSPSAPSDADIITAIGSSNPFIRLADISIVNAAASIANADITDRRSGFVLRGAGSLPPFSIAGTLVVQNGGFMPNWIVPPGVSSINRLDAIVGTAPTGTSLIARLFNITKNVTIGTVTITAGSRIGVNTSMSNPTLSTGDEIRIDITQVGSTVAGADISIQPSA